MSQLWEELRTSAFLELAMAEMEQEALAFENSRSISGRRSNALGDFKHMTR